MDAHPEMDFSKAKFSWYAKEKQNMRDYHITNKSVYICTDYYDINFVYIVWHWVSSHISKGIIVFQLL